MGMSDLPGVHKKILGRYDRPLMVQGITELS